MNIFEQITGALTGQTKNQLSQDALKAQQEIAQKTLDAEIQAQQLKYSPELSKLRTEQIAIVSGAIVLIFVVGIFIYVKFFK